MIRLDRPGTLECDQCHRAWITHPANLYDHPSARAVRPAAARDHAARNGWNRIDGRDICPRCG